MEFAIATFASKDLLVPKLGRQYNAKEAVKHHAMAVRISTSDLREGSKRKAMAKHSKKDGYILRHRTARAIDISSPLLNTLCARATVDRHKASTRTFEGVIHALKASDDTTVIEEKYKNKSRQLSTLTASEPLETLRKRLLRDEPSLNFDFVPLTLDSANEWKMAAAGLTRMFATTTPRQDYKFAGMQVFFRDGAESPFCKVAANDFRTHIITQGKKYAQQAFDQSSGRIPKRLRPVFDPRREHAEAALESSRYMLDYVDIKFSMSGSTVAAYPCKFDPSAVKSSMSHQSALKRENGRDIIFSQVKVPFGDAINDILGEAVTKHRNSPSDVFLKGNFKVLANIADRYAKGIISDEDLCKAAYDITGCELIKVAIPETEGDCPAEDSHMRQPWAFDVPPNHPNHAQYLNKLIMALGSMASYFKPMFENRLARRVYKHVDGPLGDRREDPRYSGLRVRGAECADEDGTRRHGREDQGCSSGESQGSL